MRRHFLLFAGATSIGLGAFFFACAEESPIAVVLPDAQPPPNTADAGTDTGSVIDEDSGTPATPDASIADGALPVDANALDGAVEKDAGQKVDASACGASCDCDGDGFDRPSCGNDAGRDCDDKDTRYRPNQRFVDVPPDPGRDANWNCTNGVEPLYATRVQCAAISIDCENAQGFSDAPACGQEGQYVVCKKRVDQLGCEPGTTERKRQACR